MKEYISVIVPAYNEEDHIKDAVNSVLGQTYSNFELIIIDDCSSDRTVEIIEEFAKQDDRIIVMKNAVNCGVSVSRNLAVEKAKYDWVAFLDGDDIWEPNKLEKQMEAADKTNAEIIYTGYSFIDADSAEPKGVFHIPETIEYKELLKQNVISCSGVMLRRCLLQKHKMKHDKIHEDFYTWLRMLEEGAVAIGIDEPLHSVRIAIKDSKSGNKLKSAHMTYKTYKEQGITGMKAMYYMCCYIRRSLKKYGAIR